MKTQRMHGVELTHMTDWLKDKVWENQLCFDMVNAMLLNKKLLGFGCHISDFLNKAWQLAASVTKCDMLIAHLELAE